MVWEELERLAGAYLPQWHFSGENPDIAGVIALIYTGMMEKNLQRYQEIPRRARQEIARLSEVKLAPSCPSGTWLVLDVDQAAGEGIRIPKGSRFLAKAEDKEKPFIFCTEQEILAVHAKLTDILQISQKSRSVVARTSLEPLFPVRLSDMEGEDLYREELLLFHEGILEEPVKIPRATFAPSFGRIRSVRLRSGGMGIRPELICDGNREFAWEEAEIFGRELLEYKECYIGHDEVFRRSGAEIRVSFVLQFQARRFQPDIKEEKEWKLVKRRPKTREESPVPVYAQEVSYSYYNGVGWKQLVLSEDKSRLFSRESEAEGKQNNVELVFRCPGDWQPVIAGGRELRCLRIQIVRAEHCYRADGEHHYPVAGGIRLSYSYGNPGVPPEKLIRKQGASETEITFGKRFGDRQEGAPLFFPFPYEGESTLLGFDRVFPPGMISLYLKPIEERNTGAKLRYECSAEDGFVPLKAADSTDGLSHSGTVMFRLPENAGFLEVEGKKRFWIRICVSGAYGAAFGLGAVYLNCVKACNYEWSKAKEYYLEEPVPFLECAVSGEQILEAEVFVNETETLSEEEKSRMLKGTWGREGKVHAERDYRGRISEFYVKWEEVETFGNAGGNARGYILDRQEKKIRFGDGRKWRIPEYTMGTAFYVRIKTCGGQQGNLDAMQTFYPAVPQTFLKKVFQPEHAAGGWDAETKIRTEQRRCFSLNSRKRLVSERDYLQEIRNYSGQIAEVKQIEDLDGRESFVVLMKDFARGSASFWQIKPLLQKVVRIKRGFAEGTEEIRIRQPLFVRVSVELWAYCADREELGHAQRVLRRLRNYFEPEDFWKIGKLPDETELETVLRTADDAVYLRYFNAVFQYQDEEMHTWNLGDKVELPAAVCVNGEHKVHLERRCGGRSKGYEGYEG